MDDALEWINKAVAAGFGNKYLLLFDTDLDILRGEPEWQHYSHDTKLDNERIP